MKYIVVNQPLKSTEPKEYQQFIVPLNIAESMLRSMIGQKVRIKVAENEQDWDFVILQHNGKKVMAVF